MKKTITVAAALAAIALAAPASAQSGWGNNNRYDDDRIELRLDQLQQRIQRGVERRTISRQEAVQLRDRLRELTRLERQYSRDGLSRNERRALQDRVQDLRQRIVAAERSRAAGWDDNRGRYDRDRDNRWNDGRR